MKLLSEYKENGKSAAVYYSRSKAEYLVRVDNDRHLDVKFFTEEEADAYAEDYVLMTHSEDSTLVELDEPITLHPFDTPESD